MDLKRIMAAFMELNCKYLWFYYFFFLTEVLPVTKRYACIQKQVLQVPGFAVRSFIHESHLLSLHELRNMISEIVSVSNMG